MSVTTDNHEIVTSEKHEINSGRKKTHSSFNFTITERNGKKHSQSHRLSTTR